MFTDPFGLLKPPMTMIHALLRQLRQSGARIGVGIWLIPDEYLGKEAELASSLNLHPIDAPKAYLERLPDGARFSGLSRPEGHHKLLEMIRHLCATTHPRDCLLLHTLDLLLLGLEVEERRHFWQAVLGGIPYPTTRLVLTLPEKAGALFSTELARQYAAQVARGRLE